MAAQVEIVFPLDGVDGEVTAYDRSGKKCELPHRVVISPYFYGSTAMANIGYAVVKNGNTEVSRGIVQLSGGTGNIKVTDRSIRRDPKFLKSHEEQKEPVEQETDELAEGDTDELAEGEEYVEVEVDEAVEGEAEEGYEEGEEQP
jgi:hypothetical protein